MGEFVRVCEDEDASAQPDHVDRSLSLVLGLDLPTPAGRSEFSLASLGLTLAAGWRAQLRMLRQPTCEFFRRQEYPRCSLTPNIGASVQEVDSFAMEKRLLRIWT